MKCLFLAAADSVFKTQKFDASPNQDGGAWLWMLAAPFVLVVLYLIVEWIWLAYKRRRIQKEMAEYRE